MFIHNLIIIIFFRIYYVHLGDRAVRIHTLAPGSSDAKITGPGNNPSEI